MRKQSKHFGRRRPGRLLLSAILAAFLSTGAGISLAQAPEGVKADAKEAQKRDPMDTEGLQPKLSRVLTNYYLKTFTGSENWQGIESVMFVGTLETPKGKFDFSAYKKKPNLSKVVIRSPNDRGRLVFSYDGDEAWQSNSIARDSLNISSMSPEEAKNFMRDATIGGHLLDPLLEGKQIEIAGVVEVDGKTCYEIEVILPDGQRILSAIDIVEYAEIRQVTTNQVNNAEETNYYSDFRVIEGVRFPFVSTMKTAGELVHRVEMSKILVNPGLTKSIFERPADIPPTESASPDSANPQMDGQQQAAPAVNTFGETPFGESAFPDPEAIEAKSVLEDMPLPE